MTTKLESLQPDWHSISISRRDSGLSRVLGSMTKLFSKNLHRSQDLLFLKSLVGSNACIQHEKALLVSARKRLLLLFVYHAKWFLFKNLIWKITIINNLQSFCRSTFLVIKNEKKKSYNYFSNESHSNDDYGFFFKWF